MFWRQFSPLELREMEMRGDTFMLITQPYTVAAKKRIQSNYLHYSLYFSLL